MRDMIDFGYDVTFKAIRNIADQVAEDTHSKADPIALIMARQIDEAVSDRTGQ